MCARVHTHVHAHVRVHTNVLFSCHLKFSLSKKYMHNSLKIELHQKACFRNPLLHSAPLRAPLLWGSHFELLEVFTSIPAILDPSLSDMDSLLCVVMHEVSALVHHTLRSLPPPDGGINSNKSGLIFVGLSRGARHCDILAWLVAFPSDTQCSSLGSQGLHPRLLPPHWSLPLSRLYWFLLFGPWVERSFHTSHFQLTWL